MKCFLVGLHQNIFLSALCKSYLIAQYITYYSVCESGGCYCISALIILSQLSITEMDFIWRRDTAMSILGLEKLWAIKHLYKVNQTYI